MEVKVVFNNEVANSSLAVGWGFSSLVDNRILFDTGEKGEYLFHNMENMAIDTSHIEAVVISHDHWDHTGGLWKLLEKEKGLKVYACPGFSKGFKERVKESEAQLIEVQKVTEITKNIFITGEIPGTYGGGYLPEQALIVKTEKGITIITGCSHPGIVKILKLVKEQFPEEKIYSVFGGFHLMDKGKREIEAIVQEFKKMGVENVGPTHCTGKEAEVIFKRGYSKGFMTIEAGNFFTV